ncbi:MAG: transposase [Anaerolinea sp.]|nr:transposase [Anaerolinea sp.]
MAARLGIRVSADTLLRIMRQFGVCVHSGELRIIGVDDWALKRGRTYGTVIVNLETHRVVELLPDRTAETLAAWLRTHPTIECVTRDLTSRRCGGSRCTRNPLEQWAN